MRLTQATPTPHAADNISDFRVSLPYAPSYNAAKLDSMLAAIEERWTNGPESSVKLVLSAYI